MNNRHRLVHKLQQRRFMNDVKKLSLCVPSPTFGVIVETHRYDRQKIIMATYIAVQDAMKKFEQRVIKEFSER